MFPAEKTINFISFFERNRGNLPSEIDLFFPVECWLDFTEFFGRDYIRKRYFFSLYFSGGICILFRWESVAENFIIYKLFSWNNSGLYLFNPAECYVFQVWTRHAMSTYECFEILRLKKQYQEKQIYGWWIKDSKWLKDSKITVSWELPSHFDG